MAKIKEAIEDMRGTMTRAASGEVTTGDPHSLGAA